MKLTAQRAAGFRASVYRHYETHGRTDLPWRKTRNPYRILVSEFMLQQTQVPRVRTKYMEFIERFPDFESLAGASLREVVAAWSGLGYNRRALMLKRTAEEVVARFGGRLPSRLDELLGLPGVGPATAAEISAFAFGKAHPFIETNIRSVFIHHFYRKRTTVADSEIMPLVEQTLDRGNPRRWYYALMDYGALLKRRHANPSRKSAHHVRQGRFEGSTRQARGAIIRALARRRMSERELSEETGLSLARMRSIVPRLERDGLIVSRRRTYAIAERTPGGG
jgi:A/G-specific adenine glycosylase